MSSEIFLNSKMDNNAHNILLCNFQHSTQVGYTLQNKTCWKGSDKIVHNKKLPSTNFNINFFGKRDWSMNSHTPL